MAVCAWFMPVSITPDRPGVLIASARLRLLPAGVRPYRVAAIRCGAPPNAAQRCGMSKLGDVSGGLRTWTLVASGILAVIIVATFAVLLSIVDVRRARELERRSPGGARRHETGWSGSSWTSRGRPGLPVYGGAVSGLGTCHTCPRASSRPPSVTSALAKSSI